MTEQPNWFRQLKGELDFILIAPDGAVIDWGAVRDRFLIAVLQRFELDLGGSGDLGQQLEVAKRRRLLEQRLAGVAAAELAYTINKAAAWAFTTASAQRAHWGAERSAQWGDLKRAVEASTQPPAGDQLLPPGYIDENITGLDRELLLAFYTATNSEGGTADEIHLRGIRAVLARAAGGFIVPTDVQVASPAPVEEALQRLLQWGGRPGLPGGYSSEVVMGVVNWANGGMVGALPPLPEPLRLREAAAPARPTPVDLAALHDPTFSDGLTASQHRDALRGGPDPRLPAPTDAELLKAYGHARRAYQHSGPIGDNWPREERRASTIAGLRAVLAQFGGGTPQQPAQRGEGFDMAHWIERMVTHLGDTTDYPDFRPQLFAAAALLRQQADDLAHFNAWAQGLAPLPVADRPWEQPGWCDADGRCWWTEYQRRADGPVVRWTLVKPARWSLNGRLTLLCPNGWLLPCWAIPAIPAAEAKPAEAQP